MTTFIIRLYDLTMPKVVDHVERRARIARAFAGLVAEHGFSATTYARTAATTGFSVGTVQHYFAARDDLARAAFDAILTDRDERIARIVADGEAARRPIRLLLRDALTALLPLDDGRRLEHRVLMWLRVEASQDPVLLGIARRVDADLHARVATAVTNGTGCGEVEPGTDVDVAAARVLATAHGLALAVENPGPPDPAAVLDPVLATVFTGRCRRHDPQARRPRT